MKKLIFLFIALISLSQVRAQILNPGFEDKDQNGSVANWSSNYVVMPVDSSCSWIGLDSIYFATTDAHSGNYAFETRVATYCTDAYTQKIQSHRFDVDTFADQGMLFSERPAAFTFYYKLFPVGNDKACFSLSMNDSNGVPVANGTVTLSTAAHSWTQVTVVPHYSNSNTPAIINMSFQLLPGDSVVHYGSRFLIDDISFSGGTGISGTGTARSNELYPNPATDHINIQLPAGTGKTLTIYNNLGQQVLQKILTAQFNKVDISMLAAGFYHYSLSTAVSCHTAGFIKQ